jgi:hypothetical protein
VITMSHEVLSPQQFFHASDYDYPPGRVIDPSQPHEKNFQMSHPHSVYFSTDPEHAGTYGEHLYEVEPLGEHEPDSGSWQNYVSRHPVRMVRKVERG